MSSQRSIERLRTYYREQGAKREREHIIYLLEIALQTATKKQEEYLLKWVIKLIKGD